MGISIPKWHYKLYSPSNVYFYILNSIFGLQLCKTKTERSTGKLEGPPNPRRNRMELL